MVDGHKTIAEFLAVLREKKGSEKIQLAACYWQQEQKRQRKFFHNGLRAVIPAGTEKMSFTNATEMKPQKISEPSLSASPQSPSGPISVDGRLIIGEHVIFKGVAPYSGYFHLFSLGTSGNCYKLAPSKLWNDTMVIKGESFCLPPDNVLHSNILEGSGFPVSGPPSSKNGQPERLLAILTAEKVQIDLHHLHTGLREAHNSNVRGGAGFGGPPVAGLFSLSCKWEYGLLEIEIG